MIVHVSGQQFSKLARNPGHIWAGSTTKKLNDTPLSGQRTKKTTHLSNGQKRIDREGKKFLSRVHENGRGFNQFVGMASNLHAL